MHVNVYEIWFFQSSLSDYKCNNTDSQKNSSMKENQNYQLTFPYIFSKHMHIYKYA